MTGNIARHAGDVPERRDTVMFLLVYGGSACGKSEYAEERAVSLAAARKKPLIYLAAMKPYGGAAIKRIERHRALRAGKGFQTVERYTDLKGLCADPAFAGQAAGSTILLECLSNLAANELFEPEGAGAEAGQVILEGLEMLRRLSDNLIAVTLDVFGDGRQYNEPTERFRRTLSLINREMAAQADETVRIVCSIPVILKGTGASEWNL